VPIVPKSLSLRTRPGWPHVASPGIGRLSPRSALTRRSAHSTAPSYCSARDGASSAPPRSPLLLAPPRLAMPSSTSVSLFLLHRNLCCHLSMMKPLDKRTTVATERRDGTSCGRILFLLIPIMFARHQIVSTSYSHHQFHCCNLFTRMALCQLLHKFIHVGWLHPGFPYLVN
jgi:hypothetical protein